MNKQELMDQLAEIFDTDSVRETDVLRDFASWDSLAALSLVALADSKYGFTLTVDDIKRLETVSDVCTFFENHRAK